MKIVGYDWISIEIKITHTVTHVMHHLPGNEVKLEQTMQGKKSRATGPQSITRVSQRDIQHGNVYSRVGGR